MAGDSKHVTVVRSGGAAAVELDIIPGETVDQVITLVAPQLGLPVDGQFALMGRDSTQISGDLYAAVADKDKLTLAQLEKGGRTERVQSDRNPR